MSHGAGLPEDNVLTGIGEGLLASLTRVTSRVNDWIVKVSTLCLLGAAIILTLSVVTRYFLKVSTDWQDETSVFLLVGAIFMCGAYVQSYRGHVGIEALASILPPKVDRIRKILVDIGSLAFCSFFSWKSWSMFHEAFVGGHTTTSTFAPPLWIPYSLLAFGMSLLSFQILLQIPVHFLRYREGA